ncbi:hypothetical protein C6P45_003978, partial [Maudiozyma exigua]
TNGRAAIPVPLVLFEVMGFFLYLDIMTGGSMMLYNMANFEKLEHAMRAYNIVWTYIGNNKYEVLAYFANAKVQVVFNELWIDPHNKSFFAIKAKMIPGALDKYGSVGPSDNFVSTNYIMNVLNGRLNSQVLEYSPQDDYEFRKSNPDFSEQPVMFISELKYKMMVLGLYHNHGFQEFLKKYENLIPHCPTFSYWLKIMKKEARFQGSSFKLFYLVVAVYGHYIS